MRIQNSYRGTIYYFLRWLSKRTNSIQQRSESTSMAREKERVTTICKGVNLVHGTFSFSSESRGPRRGPLSGVKFRLRENQWKQRWVTQQQDGASERAIDNSAIFTCPVLRRLYAVHANESRLWYWHIGRGTDETNRTEGRLN